MTDRADSMHGVPAHEWADEDGEPLGSWVEMDAEMWRKLIESVGGLDALAVFSTLTDPDGHYGSPQIYTAWGLPHDDTPLVDIRDYKARDGSIERRVRRRFVKAARSHA